MTLEQKKEHILRCVKLGMELFKAELVAECAPDEIEAFEKDPVFMEDVERAYAIEEFNLLQKHQTALSIAIMSGRANPVQWKLGKINPKRWGTNEEKSIVPHTIPEINLVGVKPEDDSERGDSR